MESLVDLLSATYVEVCTECGCELIVNKTFYKSCFSCDAILWKDIEGGE